MLINILFDSANFPFLCFSRSFNSTVDAAKNDNFSFVHLWEDHFKLSPNSFFFFNLTF